MSASPKEVGWSYLQAVSDGRVDDANALLDDNGTARVNDLSRKMEGPLSLMKKTMAAIVSVVPLRFTLHNSFEGGEFAALEVESNAETTHGVYNNRYCMIVQVRDGKIIDFVEYLDTRHADLLLAAVEEGLAARGETLSFE
jgi:ketosteroid isomerase-like protein